MKQTMVSPIGRKKGRGRQGGGMETAEGVGLTWGGLETTHL